MKLTVSTIKKYLATPAVVMFVVSVLLLLISITLTQHHLSYTSDDVSWQTILFNWKPFSGKTVSLGSSDNFVDKLPFFMLLGHFLRPGRMALLIESSILAVGGLACFYVSTLYFLRKIHVKLSYFELLPLAWVSSFGFAFAELYLCPIWRGFETGLSFVTFMLVAMIYYGEIKPLRSWLSRFFFVVSAAVVGILIYSDPYYLYFTIGFIVLASAVLAIIRKISRPKLLTIYGGVVLALVFSKLTALLSFKAGVRVVAVYPAQFVTFESLGNNIMTSLHGLLIIFGADFFGLPFSPHPSLLDALLNFLLLGGIIYLVYRTLKQHRLEGKKLEAQLWKLFFSGLIVFVFTIYTISTLTSIMTYRYFFILVFSGVILLAIALAEVRTPTAKRVLGGLLVCAIVANVLTSVHGGSGFLEVGNQYGNVRNNINYQLIAAVKSRGLTKGYANYWQASINTYLSGDTVAFLPTLCTPDGYVTPYHWLINDNAFQQSARRSFFVYDPDIISPATCTIPQIEHQFGLPTSKVYIGDKTILFYNYDIASKFHAELPN